MTSEALNNGTERCAAVLADLAEKPGIVINLQGDNPLIPPDYIRLLLQAFEDEEVQVATPFVRCDEAMKQNLLEHCASGTAGGTCVVTNIKGDAAYFSKYPIPWGAGAADDIKLHVGLYAYRPEALEIYANLPPSELEIAESLEQLRFIDAGIPIKTIEVQRPDSGLWEINNPEDVPLVEAALPS